MQIKRRPPRARRKNKHVTPGIYQHGADLTGFRWHDLRLRRNCSALLAKSAAAAAAAVTLLEADGAVAMAK